MIRVNNNIKTGIFIFIIFFLSLPLFSGSSAAGELDGTMWFMFMPSLKNGRERIYDSVPMSFKEIQHDGSAIKGIYGLGETELSFNGILKKLKNGYEFRIIVQDNSGNMTFTGKLTAVSKEGYSPKGRFEQMMVETATSKGVKILWKITNATLHGSREFTGTGRTTFKLSGFIIKPK